MIIFFMAGLLGSERPAFTIYLAGVETLLEAFMLSALMMVMK